LLFSIANRTKIHKKLNLEKIKIDSFKLRVPLVCVEIVDSKFASKYQKVFVETGEIDEYINLDKNKVHIENGITSRIGIVHSMDTNGGGEYIVFQINAKQLKKRYFEGINRNNIKAIYNYLMSFNLVYLNYSAFLNGLISDVDLCFDYRISRKGMQETNQKVYESILPHCYKYVQKPFGRKNNTGIQFNDRAKATPSKPYCKIYHKTTELETKSEDFAKAYLTDINFHNLGRFEYTIKNSKHKSYLRLKYQSLDDFLKIQQKTLERFFFNGIKAYTTSKSIIREYKDLSPTDRLLLIMINKLIERGADKQNIYTALYNFDIPQEKSRMKKKLINLLENVDDNYRLIANQESMQMLRVLRLDL
tara:strand:+ start:3842 stop:4927 length:1086 start_codon:yes stop_codon:yes gene_type:complete